MMSLLMAAMLFGAMNLVTESVFAAEDTAPVWMRANTAESCNATPQERTAIIKAIEHYINAGRMGKAVRLARALQTRPPCPGQRMTRLNPCL